MSLRIGSLCTGYGGLDMAVQRVFGGRLAWVADIDPGASKILAHRYPGVPNLSDLTTTDWDEVEPVDIVCGGYPCQPFSAAGLRKGVEDERHIWPYIATALRVLRPRVAIFENVAGHLRRGFDTVLADLADLGFDAEWCTLRASEIGAPHRRERLFILATAQDADGEPWVEAPRPAPRQAQSGRSWADFGGRGGTPTADAGRARHRTVSGGASGDAGWDGGRPSVGHHEPVRAGTQRHGPAPADAVRDAVRQQPVPEPRCSGEAVAELPGVEWGAYGPAIRRWENALGRPAPRATEPGRTGERLSPVFVEWLMGLPTGHVTQVPDLSRNQQLHALGNGVVPAQAAYALRLLAARISSDVAA